MNKSIMVERIKNGKFTLLAEIGVNYFDIAKKLNISLIEAAKFMIMAAANAGVHGVKFQSYKAGTLAAKDSPYYWDITEEPTISQYELFKKFDKFGEAEYQELADFCNKIGVEFCSTPFDTDSADYLNTMMNVYKISSSDLTNIPFIEYMARKNKPIFLSVGAGQRLRHEGQGRQGPDRHGRDCQLRPNERRGMIAKKLTAASGLGCCGHSLFIYCSGPCGGRCCGGAGRITISIGASYFRQANRKNGIVTGMTMESTKYTTAYSGRVERYSRYRLI